jgi:hypothetical protein
MIVNREKLAWAAGIYEGEGCIGAYPRPKISNSSIRIQVAMSDGDIVTRWGEIIGRGCLNGPYFRKNFKPNFIWGMSGYENCQYTIAILWEWLGVRRREQAQTMLGRYLELRPHPPHRGTETHCVKGHERKSNTYFYIKKDGKVASYCIPCNQESGRRYRERVGTA